MATSLEQFREYIEKGLIDEDIIRYEQVGNVIYLMSVPTKEHEDIVYEVFGQFREYLKDSSCKAYGPTTGLDLFNMVSFLKELEAFQTLFKDKLKKGSENIYLLPDLQVICNTSRDLFGSNGYKGIPKLIVEVLSPSTADKDLEEKLELYAAIGVSEYWIIHDVRNVWVHLLDTNTLKYVRTVYSLDTLENSFIYLKSILEVPVKSFKDLTIKFDPKNIFK